MTNPYESPRQLGSPLNDAGLLGEAKFLLVQKFYRWLIASLLTVFVVAMPMIVLGCLGEKFDSPLLLSGIVLGNGAVLFMWIAVFLLARELWGVTRAIVCAILFFVPIIWLVMMFMLIGRATRTMRQQLLAIRLAESRDTQSTAM